MKFMLSFLFVLFFLVGNSQKKKSFVWPKPLRDSSWVEVKCDTIHGIIEVPSGSNKIIGEGIVTSCETTHWSKPIYSKRGQELIDSVYALPYTQWPDAIILSSGSGFSSGEPQKTFYLKTEQGYKRVDNAVFRPK